MFDSVKNVTKLLRIISAHDNQGDSKKEIDTKQEYEYLGAFLNGEEITERAGLLGYTVYTYADLSSDDKKTLLEKMKSMENKYGKWTNKFSGNAPLDSKTAFDYLLRYQNFQEKLESFESEIERNNYYNDIKEELNQIEAKLKDFCSKYKIQTELSRENTDKLQNEFFEIKTDLEIREFLSDYKDDFQITKDNAQEYADFLNEITNEYTPKVISTEEYTKVVDILKKSLIKFLQPMCDEKLDEENISSNISSRTGAIMYRAECIELEKNIKTILENINSSKITKQNAQMYAIMYSHLDFGKSAGILTEKEREKAKTVLYDLWNKFIPEYLSEEERENLSMTGQKTEVLARIKKENNGTYKRYETKITEILHIGENFKLTPDNAEFFIKVYDYLNQKRLDSSVLSDEEFNKANDIIAKAFIDFLEPFNTDDESYTVENLKNKDIQFCINSAIDNYEKLNSIKGCGDIIQQAIDKPYDNTILQNRVNQYIKDNNIPELKNVPKDVDVGNGKFDRVSTQKTNNCWAHAGINSLLSTEEGKTFIERNYYRDEKTGIIAVHIPEADEFGVHDGIFIVTPQEIIDAQGTVASGEGDITAYMIAIQKYFDEVKSNPELKEKLESQRIFLEQDVGNSGFRFYELITGGYHTEFQQIDSIKEELKIQKGIGISTHFDAKALYKMIENKEGAMTISLSHMEHSISVIGVKDGKFLIQESNNNPEIFDNEFDENNERMFTQEESVNGRPTFGLSISNLDKYGIGAINFIKFK